MGYGSDGVAGIWAAAEDGLLATVRAGAGACFDPEVAEEGSKVAELPHSP